MSAYLAEAERADGYRAKCRASPYNAAARAKDEYEPFFVDQATAAALEALATEVPLLHRSRIIILKPSADSGFPHTRPGLICMPSTTCNQAGTFKTLVHEAIHLHQREFLRDWKGFCIEEGWTERSSIPTAYMARVRINPDTMMCPFWSWQEHYIPLPLFVDKPTISLKDADIKWLDRRTGGLTTPPPSFTARYGSPSQPEHPFELYAVEMADKCRTDADVFNIIRR